MSDTKSYQNDFFVCIILNIQKLKYIQSALSSTKGHLPVGYMMMVGRKVVVEAVEASE